MAESNTAPVGQELPPLPKWIDDHKGADPFMDDVITYIESTQSQYAERIRHLERELEQSRAAFIDTGKRPVQSIDTPEFHEFLSAYDDAASYGSLTHARAALIAYIDGRSAGTAPDGWKLVPEVPTNEMVCAIERKVDEQLVASGIYPADMCRQDGADIYEAMIAAAPTPTNSGREEANEN